VIFVRSHILDRNPDSAKFQEQPMNMDTGLAAVIIAVLIFYLRLIVLQREQAKRARLAALKPSRKTRKTGASQPQPAQNFSILSKNRVDLAIAGAGLLAILIGVLANAQVIRLPALQTYWWLPTALGIVAFSWAFKLPAR
jgi:divalent metal cation (Fe/Co/Zn/Cd) transporter